MRTSSAKRRGFGYSPVCAALLFIVAWIAKPGATAYGNPVMYWADADSNIIRKAESSDPALTQTHVTFQASTPRGLRVNSSNGDIYWVDQGSSSIKFFDASEETVGIVVDGLNIPQDLALDLDNDKIFWVESGGTDRIRRANINDGRNSGVETLIGSGIFGIRGIALDITGNKMYWTEAEVGGDGVFRSNIEGTRVAEAVVTGLQFPVGIALDLTTGRMYWVDSGGAGTGGAPDRIHWANMSDGGGRDSVTIGPGDARYIALDLKAGKMYWTDIVRHQVRRANLDGGSVEDLITTTTAIPQGIDLFQLQCQIGGGTASVCEQTQNTQYAANVRPADNIFYSWSISGNGTIDGATNGSTVRVDALAQGSYTLNLQVTRMKCTATCSRVVTVNPNPTCTISGPSAVCAGSSSHSYSSSVSPLGGTVIYGWSISGNGSITGATNGSSVNVTAGAAGSYTLTLDVTRSGCFGQCQKVVTVNPNASCTISGPDPVCPGSNGHSYSASVMPAGGTMISYAWSITGNGSIVGSTSASSVTVNAEVSGSFTLNLSVTRNGCPGSCSKTVTVSQNTTCSISGPDPVCASSTGNDYTATVFPAAGTMLSYQWSITPQGSAVIAGSSTSSTVTVTAGSPGSFTLNLNVTRNGCPGSCSKSVTVGQAPSCAITGPSLVCEGESAVPYSATVNPPDGTVTYQWMVSGTASIVGAATGSAVTIDPTSAGSFTLTLNVTRDQCPGQCSFPVTVNPGPSCTITGVQSVCEGTTDLAYAATVSPPGGVAQYDWQLQGNGSIKGGRTGSSVTVDAGSPGSFTLNLTVTRDGCIGTCTQPVTVHANPTCSIEGPDPVCEFSDQVYTSTTMPTGGIVSYQWSVSGNANIAGPATGQSVNIDVGPSGNFTLHLTTTRNGCEGTCSKTVIVNPNPTCVISGPDVVCEGTAGYSFNASVEPAGGSVTYAWSIESGASIVGQDTGSSILVNSGVPGSFTVTLTIERNGCQESCSKLVTVNPLPVCTIEAPDDDVCVETGAVFTSTVTPSDNVQYLWSITGNGSIPDSKTDSTVRVIAGSAGEYTLSLDVTRMGCSGFCLKVVSVVNCGATDTLLIATGTETYHGISVPVATGGIYVDLLDLGEPDATKWRLGHYFPQQGGYAEAAGGLSTVETGKGYWLITRSGQTLKAIGTPISDSKKTVVLEGGDAAWNQIGNPFMSAMPMDLIQVESSGNTVPFFSSANIYTSPVIYLWDVDQQGHEPTTDPQGRVIEKAQSFWVQKLIQGPVSVTMWKGAPSPYSFASSSNPHTPIQWSVQITARQGKRAATPLTVGVADVTPYEWNVLDLSLPPMPPARFLTLSIPKPDWGHRAGVYVREFKAPSEPWSWDFVLDGVITPGEVALELSTENLPLGVKLRLTEDDGSVDEIVTSGQTVTLAATSSSRHFRLSAGEFNDQPRESAKVHFAAYPNPFKAQTGFRFAPSTGVDLSVTIYDLQGRRIRELERPNPASGESVLLWNGRDDSGKPVGPGVYIVRYRAGGEVGHLRIVRL